MDELNALDREMDSELIETTLTLRIGDDVHSISGILMERGQLFFLQSIHGAVLDSADID